MTFLRGSGGVEVLSQLFIKLQDLLLVENYFKSLQMNKIMVSVNRLIYIVTQQIEFCHKANGAFLLYVCWIKCRNR